MKIKRAILVFFLGVMFIPLTCLGGFAELTIGESYLLNGYVEAGGGWLSPSPRFMNRSYLTQYVPFPEGALGYADLNLKSKDGLEYYNFYMYQPGLRSQEYRLQVGRLGVYHAEIDFNELQHIYSRVNPNDTDIRTHIYNLRASGWFNITPDLTVFAENEFWRRTGSQPATYVTGPPNAYNSFAINLRPIDYKQDDVKVGAEYDRPRGQFRVFYHFSVFDDGNQTFVGNPNGVVTTVGSPIRGALSTIVTLPPGNNANYVTAEGGFNLPDVKTRINGSLTYGWLSQNNTVFNSSFQSQGQAGLSATTLAAYLGGVSRPIAIDGLTLKYSYRAYNYNQDNNAANNVLDRAFGINAAIPNTNLLRAEQYSYLSQAVNFCADYKVNSQLALTAGYSWKGFNRTQGQGTTSTNTPSAGLRWCPTDWLNLIANYSYSARRGTDYIAGVPQPGEPTTNLLPVTYKFYAGTMSRNTVNFIAEASPVNNVTFSVNSSLYATDYKNSFWGLQSDSAWSAGADVSWRPADRVALSLGYDHQSVKTRTTAIDSHQFVAPGIVSSALTSGDSGFMLWTSDTYDTFSLKGDFALIPDRLKFTSSGNYSFSNSNFHNPQIPNLNQSYFDSNTYFTYKFNEHWAASVGYIFQYFKQSSAYQTLYLQGVTATGVAGNSQRLNTLDGFYPNGTAHLVQGFLRYKF